MSSLPLPTSTEPAAAAAEASIWDLLGSLWRHRLLLSVVPLLAGALAFGVATVLPKTYTARTTLITPQQQGAGAAALASLGALSGLAGAAAGLRNPGDQYIALLQSQAVADAIVRRFDLMQVYEVRYLELARRELRERSRMLLGRKDNLIVIEVDDTDPKRAADIANRHVEELRGLTNRLAVTEAQQRRVFFETQLKQTRDQLVKAQVALQSAGFAEGNLRAEPKAAAEGYSRLRAEITATEVRLGVLRRSMTDNAPEVQAQATALQGLRAELARLEAVTARTGPGSDYIDRDREFKYQETLFDLFARQFELARIDESREGGMIQVVDEAVPPELHSKPKRAMLSLGAALLALAGLVGYLLARRFLALRSAPGASASAT